MPYLVVGDLLHSYISEYQHCHLKVELPSERIQIHIRTNQC